jgi:precorrin-4 methylase
VPATLAIASSCVALSAVPYAIAPGVTQVIAGATLLTVNVTLAVAEL